MAFLNPRTACPRSEPTVRSFLAPNTTSTTSRMTTSSRIPIPIRHHSTWSASAEEYELDDRSNEPCQPHKFAPVSDLLHARVLGRLQPEGHRPVIDQRHLHVGSKYTCGNRGIRGPSAAEQQREQLLRLL